MTTQQDDMNRNPTGKGGFGDHPENRNPGGWKPEFTFSYQYKKFLNMPVDDFKEWKNKPENANRTMVEELAYNAVLKARTEFKERQEITDRVEGKAPQTVVVEGGFFKQEKLSIEVVDNKNVDPQTE